MRRSASELYGFWKKAVTRSFDWCGGIAWTNEFFGEFMGTLVLILMGNGVVANVLLRKSKAENAGWIVITAGWALAVMTGVFTAIACGSPDAHLNPAVTLGVAVSTGDFSKIRAVLAGAAAGRDGRGARWSGCISCRTGARRPTPTLKLACFCDRRPRFATSRPNLISEIIGTFVLVLVGTAIFAEGGRRRRARAPGIGPYLVGSLVWGIGLSLGGTTGYAINPARDLGPRIAHTILPIAKKGDSDWGYAAVPIVGPLIGGALAGLFTKLVF